MHIDTSFSMYTDANKRDPDLYSLTLRRYHQKLWSKPLPCGVEFTLAHKGRYLCHTSELGTFFLGSEAITHSYSKHERKRWLTSQIPDEVADFFARNATIGSYTLFPNKQINRKHSINQARGVNRFIDDRFDLTLGMHPTPLRWWSKPIIGVLNRYGDFFALFESFEGYTDSSFCKTLLPVMAPSNFTFPSMDLLPDLNSVA